MDLGRRLRAVARRARAAGRHRRARSRARAPCKYAGFAGDRIDVVPDLARRSTAGSSCRPAGEELVLLPTYTAMLALRKIIGELGHVRPYWERAA